MSKQSRDTVNTAIIAHGDAELARLREQVRVLAGAIKFALDDSIDGHIRVAGVVMLRGALAKVKP